MIKRNFFTKVLSSIIVFSLCVPYGFAQEVGKVTYVEGRVDILKPGSQKGTPVRDYEAVSVGDSIRTKSNSKAEIKFKDDSIVRIAQNSKIEIKDYQLDEKNKRKLAAVKLERGKVRTIVAKMPHPADFAILTPNTEGVVKGSDVFAFYQAGSSGMLVAEGKLAVTNIAHPESMVTIPAGSSVLVPLEKLPEGPRPYLELEKKLYEQDTDVPFSGAKAAKLTVITGTITKFSGKVQVTTQGQAKSHDAKLNEIVKEGDLIETGDKGIVEIRLDNNNAINMKPNSKMSIIKLLYNPSTGEYENIFELTIGKIKARIEGLKGKSKFEVKTPLAICGARGTILYVNSSPNNTTSFLEGGNGYIINTSDGVLNDIPAGEQGSVNEQGVFQTSGVNQDDRQGFSEGWDPGSGVEGYSAPEGTTGEYLYDSDTDANTGAGDGTNTDTDTGAGTADTGTGEPVTLPFTETNPTTTTTTTTTEPVTLSGDFSGAFGLYEDELDEWGNPRGLILNCGTINNGVVAATGDIWAGSAQPFTLNADFNFSDLSSNHDLDLWASDEDFNLIASTVDGATIAGIAGGIKNNNSLKGLSYAFYIKPDGSVGYLKSADLAGSLSAMPSGTFSLTGTIISQQLGMSTFPVEVQGFSEDELINGKVGGDISGVMDLSHALIKGQHWGLWRAGLGGPSISTSLSNNWSAVAGGKDDHIDHTFRFLIDINGTSAGNNELFATINGIGLDYDPDDPIELGYLTTIFDGELRGIYDNEMDHWWEAVAAGAYTETPLAFGGEINIDEGFGYYDTLGRDVELHNGSLSLSFGGTESLWQVSPAQVTLLGEYANASNYKLWGYEWVSGNTADGGKFFGALGGTNINNSLKGMSVMLYIRPNSSSPTGYSAGYLRSSDINGNFYPDIHMLYATGHYTHYLDVPTNVLPSQLYAGSPYIDDHHETDDYGLIGGDISGNLTVTSTDLVEPSGNEANWGIWRIGAGGTFSGSPSNNWHAVTGGKNTNETTGALDGYWLGDINGDSWSADGSLSASVSGVWIDKFFISGPTDVDYLGTFQGDLLGAYQTNPNTWQALSVGVYTDTPLTFGGEFTGSFGYYDYDAPEPEVYLNNGSFSALIGGTNSLWGTTPTAFTLIGEFANSGAYKLWGTDEDDFTGTTSDGARFLGLIGGNKLGDNSLKGLSYAFYVRPDPTYDPNVPNSNKYLAGYLRSNDISGNFYQSIGMFKADGTFSHYRDLPTTIRPDELYDESPKLEYARDHRGLISGPTFSGTIGAGESAYLSESPDVSEDWGLWWHGVGGTYTSLPAPGSTARIGGWTFYEDPGETDGYYLGTLLIADGFSGTADITVLTNTWIGHATGDTVGIYNPTNQTWEGLSAGVYLRDTDLTSSGRFVAQGWQVSTDFDFAGQIGLIGPIWSANAHPDFISIGEFNSGGATQFAWVVQKETSALEDGFVSRYITQDSPLTYNYSTYDDGNGVGSFYGLSAGVGGNVVNGEKTLKGKTYSLYISPTATANVFDAGVLYGDVDGNYYDGIGMYRLDGELTKSLSLNMHTHNIGISPEKLYEKIKWHPLSHFTGQGGFGAEGNIGEINANWGEGTVMKITGQNWGIWNVITGGEYSGTTSNDWSVKNLTGTITKEGNGEESEVRGAWLGGITGTQWSGQEIEGDLDAIWIQLHKDGTLSGRKVGGEVVGNYIEVDTANPANNHTWRSGSAGEWVEVNSMLDKNNLKNDIIALGQAANVPITEVYSSIMTGSGGGITSMTMDTRLYSMNPSMADGIWAAIINGDYLTAPTTNWTITVNNGANDATLSGPAWSTDGHWTATNVTGTVGGNTITDGQAAGTYTPVETGGGTFTGAGTGTTTAPTTP
ncbi:MAG: FecR family protein [Candidatus Omnitrophota bacterium]|nr:FecR family protein [Candidatus Omnitrophota bacterium]